MTNAQSKAVCEELVRVKAALAALRQRHARAVDCIEVTRARIGLALGSPALMGCDDIDILALAFEHCAAWLASDAKAALENTP